MLTPEQREQYLKNPNRCPFCRSENISGGEWQYSNNRCYQSIICGDCEKEWTDTYTLTDVTEEEGDVLEELNARE